MSRSQTDRPYDVITFGDMCVDLMVRGDDVTPRFGQVEKLVGDYALEMGGSACIFACQAARLGLRVAVLGRVGDDDFGRLAVRRLAAGGVDTRHIGIDPGLKTGLGVALCQGGDRAILTYAGSLDALEPAHVTDELLATACHLHHASFFLQTRLRPAIPAIFRRARALGLSTSLDTGWDPDERWNTTLFDVLPLTDVFMPNEQEALRITGAASGDAAAAALLAHGAGAVFLKRGEAGASLYTATDELHLSVMPVAGGDSVGAGDSADAGFLAGWLRNLPPAACLGFANFCGRAVAGAIGGLLGQPDWPAISVMLEGSNAS